MSGSQRTKKSSWVDRSLIQTKTKTQIILRRVFLGSMNTIKPKYWQYRHRNQLPRKNRLAKRKSQLWYKKHLWNPHQLLCRLILWRKMRNQLKLFHLRRSLRRRKNLKFSLRRSNLKRKESNKTKRLQVKIKSLILLRHLMSRSKLTKKSLLSLKKNSE